MAVSGNSYHGLIEEFPGIAVDKFNARANIFILTHAHADHLTGLENDCFSNIVYCTELTKTFLSHDPKYRRALHRLRTVEYNDPHKIVLGAEEITMTFIPSYHCPGSCMVLLEGVDKAILVTGDIRAEEWWTLSLRKNPYLFPYTTSFRTLDNIYFDSTFTYRGEPFIEMIPNSEGVDAAAKLLSLFPTDDPDIQFYFVDSTLGFEEAWGQIVNVLGAKFHASPRIQKRISALSGPQKLVLQSHQDDAIPSKQQIFHACGNNPERCDHAHKPKFTVKIKQCIDFNIRDFTGMCVPLALATLPEDERAKDLSLIGETKMRNKLYHFRGRDWILPRNGQELLPTVIKLVFSRHSSYTETRNFISTFSTKQVYPCVESKESWMRGFSMSKLFGSLCQSKTFSYDQKRSKELGDPPRWLLERPIQTINRWCVEECQEEEEFVMKSLGFHTEPVQQEDCSTNDQSPKISFKFLGQNKTMKYLKDKDFIRQRRRDMQLEKIIIGRGEGRFKAFIEEQQSKYKGFGSKDNPLHQNYGRRIERSVLHKDYTDSETTESSLDASFDNLINSNGVHGANACVDVPFQPEVEGKSTNRNFTSSISTMIEETPLGTQMQSCSTNALQTTSFRNKPRPRLNRINKLQSRARTASRTSFVRSSFSSFENSFTRASSAFVAEKAQSLRGIEAECKGEHSKGFSILHSVFYRTDFEVDNDAVRKISDELQTNALHWFGFDLKST